MGKVREGMAASNERAREETCVNSEDERGQGRRTDSCINNIRDVNNFHLPSRAAALNRELRGRFNFFLGE